MVVMVMVRPVAIDGTDKGLNRILVASGVANQLTALAPALVRRDVGAGGYLLQKQRDGFGALIALEGEGAGGFAHRIGLECGVIRRCRWFPAEQRAF
jgi:hypothetical protein